MLNTTLIREKLIPALRSGEFEQAAGRLRVTEYGGRISHCCLGVACEVSLRSELIRGNWSDGDTISIWGGTMNERYELPGEVQDVYGFPSSEGVIVSINGMERSLAGHNDNGSTFAEIADALVTYCNGYDEARADFDTELLDN